MGVDDVIAAAQAARESSMRWHEQEAAGKALAPPRYTFNIRFDGTKDTATRILKLVMDLDTSNRHYSGPPLDMIPDSRGGGEK